MDHVNVALVGEVVKTVWGEVEPLHPAISFEIAPGDEAHDVEAV